MTKIYALLLVLFSLNNNLYAMTPYVKLEGVMGVYNACPSIVTITPATQNADETRVIGAPLSPAPKIDRFRTISGAVGLDWGLLCYQTEISLLHAPKISYKQQQDPLAPNAAAPAANANAAPFITQFDYGVTAIFANLIFKIPTPIIRPFGILGGGVLRKSLCCFETYDDKLALQTSVSEGERWGLGWHVGGGLSCKLYDILDLDLGLRYTNFDILSTGIEQKDAQGAVTKIDAKNFGVVNGFQVFLATKIYF